MKKILSITNELSLKNYSITSLIQFAEKNILLDVDTQFHTLVSEVKNNEFVLNKNITTIKLKNLFYFFHDIKKIIKTIKNFDIIHMHGVWAPIQILSIIISSFLNKKIIIQPHGMYLDQALRSQGNISYFVKRILIVALNFFEREKTIYLAITNQEKRYLAKLFPRAKIFQIANPLPFEIARLGKKILLRNFVFFGRINQIKNIDLIINSFIQAGLSTDWKLKIYGIPDDKIYERQLKEKIKSTNNIQILNPIFGRNKQVVLSSSWCNIILSKSEVLSLSIIESVYCELPSLVTSKIDLKSLGSSFIITKPEVQAVVKKIQEISRWDFNERIEIGKILKISVNKKYNQRTILAKYRSLYNAILAENLNIKNIKISFFQIFIISISYSFNLLFSSLLVVFATIFSNESLGAEVAIGSGLFLALTQILSSNKRALIVSDDNLNLINKTKLFRTLISIFAFIPISTCFIFLNFEYLKIVYLISAIVIFQWIFEMDLIRAEVEKKIKIFFLISIFGFASIALCLLFLWQTNLFALQFFLTIQVIALIIMIFLSNKFFNFSNIRFVSLRYLTLNIYTLSYISTFATVLSFYAWRVGIYYLATKKIAAIIFSSFAIGSFPGTFFNSILGPIFIKNKVGSNIKFKKKYFIYIPSLIFLSISCFLFIEMINYDYTDKLFFLFSIFLSLAGSPWMIVAMYYRHLMISSIKLRDKVFYNDIFYGIVLIVFPFTLYFVGGSFFITGSFFLGSLFSYLVYSPIYQKHIKYNV